MKDIIKKNASAYQKISKANGVCIGLQLFHGELSKVTEDNPSLSKAEITERNSFPDIISPKTDRNDFYLTLEGGEFSQERKKSAKNVEVVITVIIILIFFIEIFF
jgi:hypothetical protein